MARQGQWTQGACPQSGEAPGWVLVKFPDLATVFQGERKASLRETACPEDGTGAVKGRRFRDFSIICWDLA